MQKKKLIIGLSLSGILVVSGATLALAQGSAPWQTPVIGTVQTASSSVTSPNIKTLANPTLPIELNVDSTQPVPSNGTTPNGTPENSYNGYGYGMMGGYGGTNGVGGYGMMGGGYNAASLGINLTNGQVENSDQAVTIAKAYVQKLNTGLTVDELHEFSDSYEVELKHAKTGEKAYEFMIGKSGGVIFAEMGPNVMWNTKYGHMNGGNQENQTDLTVSVDQATKLAQDFVAKIGKGYSVSEPETAPGYYEFMVSKDGKDYAELDVNGYTGQVWYENWHGSIVNTVEADS